MRCLHHLRAASGEWSNIHVGLVATTPLFEEETYRKVCRMGRDAPFSAKMNQAHLHQGAILGHPAWHVLMALFLQVSSSLTPMQVYWRMLHCPAAKPRVATGLRERGLLSTAQVQCGKNGVFDGGYLAWLYLFIYVIIVLYSYILIYLYCYCLVCLLCCLFIALLHAYSIGVLLSLYLLYLLGILSLGTVLSLGSLL